MDWDARYRSGETPWELGGPAPPLVDMLREFRDSLGRTLVPGCGRGDDALYAASLGADVTGWDLAPSAIAAAQAAARRRGLEAAFAVRDALSPGPDDEGEFDTIVEHTFFCALPPALRPRYAESMARLLRPRGRLLGLFYIGDPGKGPPYGASEEELHTLFAPYVHIARLAVAPNSPGMWAGRERVAVFEKPAG